MLHCDHLVFCAIYCTGGLEQSFILLKVSYKIAINSLSPQSTGLVKNGWQAVGCCADAISVCCWWEILFHGR